MRVLMTLLLVFFVLAPLLGSGSMLAGGGLLLLVFGGSESTGTGWLLVGVGVVLALLGAGVIVLMVRAAQKSSRTRVAMGAPVLSWQAAEQMAANHMRAFGFSDARTTPAGADGGLDVVSRFGVAQVKYHRNPVGRPDVQKLRGAAHGHQRALFYSVSGYTQGAFEFASQANIALFQFNQAGMVWPLNAVAKAYRKPEPAEA